MSGYRGPDRRGLIGVRGEVDADVPVVALIAGMLAAPFAIAEVASLAGLSNAPLGTGAADTAFVAYVIILGLLALRWRLVGEAACFDFLIASLLAAVFVVPLTTHRADLTGYLGALRATAIVLLLGRCVVALRSPDVRSDVRPLRAASSVVVAALLLALPLGLTSAHSLLAWRPAGPDVFELLEACACVGASASLVVSGIRRGRIVPIAFGAAVATIGLACVSRALPQVAPLARPSVPPLAILSGGIVILAMLAGDAHRVLSDVVLQDVRGRRRWEAAERELTVVRAHDQEQRHDLRSVLSAVDGSLFVLSQHQPPMPSEPIERLIAATREQVHLVQALLGGVGEAQTYDLSSLLHAIVAVRAAGGGPVSCDLPARLPVHGRPDRIAPLVHNLLMNASLHARGASVLLRAACHVDTIEIEVSDDGPGLEPDQLEQALERGWRGCKDAAGNGLGLFQARELAAAEGGTIALQPTHPGAPAGTRGLTARVLIPLRGAGEPRVSPAAEPALF